MYLRILPLLFMIFVANASAMQFPLEIIERFDEFRIVVYANQADLDKAPAWEPGKGAPPLSIEKLLRIITQQASEDARLHNAIIQKIELKPIRQYQAGQHWYYLVQLKVFTGEHPSMQYIAVLMDGKVLPAVSEPDSYK